jgi:glycine cleavage system H protein
MSDEEDYPPDLKYTREHEWTRIDGKMVTVGITKFAVEQLGDITQVELPKEGESVKKGDVFGTVESVKAVSDVYSPAAGKIVKVNSPLGDTPEYLSDDPYDEGWMIQLEITNPADLEDLMDAAAYRDFVAEQE